jgi:hypothetical protein
MTSAASAMRSNAASARSSTSLSVPAPRGTLVVDGQVFVRAANGPTSRWYQAAIVQGAGRVRVEDRDYEVRFAAAPADLADAIDTAYEDKYPGSAAVPVMQGDRPKSATAILLTGRRAPETAASIGVLLAQAGFAAGATVGGVTITVLRVAAIPLVALAFATGSIIIATTLRRVPSKRFDGERTWNQTPEPAGQRCLQAELTTSSPSKQYRADPAQDLADRRSGRASVRSVTGTTTGRGEVAWSGGVRRRAGR